MHLVPLPIIALQARIQGGMAGGDSAWGAGLDGSAAFPWAPALLLGGPAVIAAGLLWWYFRTARTLRQAQLTPPVWLLPYLEQKLDPPPAWPPPETSADAMGEQIERTESVGRLARRKRAILLGLALNFVAGWAMAGAYLYESRRGPEFQELPGPTTLATSIDTLGFQGMEEPGEVAPVIPPPPPPLPAAAPTPAPVPAAPVDAAELQRRNDQRLAAIRRRDSLLAIRRTDSIAAARQELQRLRDSIALAVQDSLTRAARVVPTPVVVAPAPPPPPPPAPPPPTPPPPDPAVELARAAGAIRAAAGGLVASIGSREGLSGILAPGAARDGFLRFVQQSAPAASLVSVAEPLLLSDRATSNVTVQFQWRGTFGDTRRRTARFQAAAVRDGSTWRVASFTVLDNLP